MNTATTLNNENGNRASILVEDGEILQQQMFPGHQYVLALKAPQIARRAKAGQFVHVRCGIALPMRRPLSIMRVDETAGTLELLYKVVGEGTAILAQRQKNEHLSLLGPIGNPFILDKQRPRPLLIGGGVGIPPLIFLADTLRRSERDYRPFAILGSELPFPFATLESKFLVPTLPEDKDYGLKILDDWGIPSRLTSRQGFPGCFDGYVTDLARLWLDSLSPAQRAEVGIYSCGPTPMLAAVAKLAAEYQLPCQVSLEEYMACAVGGCAGCVVKVQTATGPAMKRVCVDGPVFDAYSVFTA